MEEIMNCKVSFDFCPLMYILVSQCNLVPETTEAKRVSAALQQRNTYTQSIVACYERYLEVDVEVVAELLRNHWRRSFPTRPTLQSLIELNISYSGHLYGP